MPGEYSAQNELGWQASYVCASVLKKGCVSSHDGSVVAHYFAGVPVRRCFLISVMRQNKSR